MSLLWRSQLFSAIGAGFSSDATVTDGVHLRWIGNPKLGLPFEKKDRKWGNFQVFVRINKYPCIQSATLAALKAETPIPVHCEGDADPDYRLKTVDRTFYFLKKLEDPVHASIQHLLNQLRMIRQWRLTPEQRGCYRYIRQTIRALAGEPDMPNTHFEIAEVCAIDINFMPGQGTNPRGVGPVLDEIPDIRDGHIHRPINPLAERKSVWVRAYDSRNRLVAQDWAGWLAFRSEHNTRASSRNKFTVRLRAPGIHHISINPVPGQQVMNRTGMCWVFCEEYCRAGVWTPLVQPQLPIRFNANPEMFTPAAFKQYYKPFKKILDWPVAANTWVGEVLQTEGVQNLLACENTYDMFSSAIDMPEEGQDAAVTNNKATMPVLPALISAAMDPAVASLVGLYHHTTENISGKDVKAEAIFPFFEPENLSSLANQLKLLAIAGNVPYLLQDFMGLFSEPRKIFVRLAGLVFCPNTNPKPVLPNLAAFTANVTAVGLPMEAPPHEVLLMVDSVMRIPAPPFSLLPYLNVHAIEVKRSIEGSTFANITEVDETTGLEKLGILPPVYFPAKNDTHTTLAVRDDFSLSLPPANQVQYQVRPFDIFGRPGGFTIGSLTDIPIPCHLPATPAAHAPNVTAVDDFLWLELFVTLNGEAKPLHAIPQTLEMAFHTVDPRSTGSVEDVQWTGERPARGLLVNFDAAHQYPDPATAQLTCFSFGWSGLQINWNTAPPGFCNPVFPPEPPMMEVYTAAIMENVTATFRTFRIRMAVAALGSLAAGDHLWCCRMRVRGTCEDGDKKYSRESFVSFTYRMVPPPPPVIQPPASIIPESTFADKQGNSYYNVLLNNFVSSSTGPGQPMANIYRIDLKHLQPQLNELVEGNILLAGAETKLHRLARANRSPFKKVNEEPVPVNTSPTYYAVPVPGGLELYHVLGIVGANAETEETSWDTASILLFKTPQPVPKPKLRFAGINSFTSNNQLKGRISFRADFKTAVDAALRPAIQVLRHDLSAAQTRFVGQVMGEWNEAGFYHFDFTDDRLIPWRNYRYEAILLSSSGGKWVKSEHRASGEMLAPGLDATPPIDESFPFFIEPVAGGWRLAFQMLVGNFNFSLTRTAPDGTQVRHSGKISNKNIQGLPGALLSMDATGLHYGLQWTDTQGGPATYTLRLSRAQQMPWSIKILTP
ncbi:MAG: hypothetical protein WKF97_06180 [Chitinophagaceae bacterium]